MLTIKNLTIYRNNGEKLIDDLSFTMKDNKKIAIIGEEGNGKSTLLKAILNKEKILDYTSMTGNIFCDGSIGYLPQHIETQWEESYLYEYLLKNTSDDEILPEKYNELSEYERLCISMNINSEFIQRNQKIKTLSGGEKVKIQLLKLMKNSYDYLLLDEPTNDLDIETLVWLENFIENYEKAILFISHDETLLKKCAQGFIHIEQVNKKSKAKHTIYMGDYKSYVEERYAKYDKEEKLVQKSKKEMAKKQEKLNNIRNAVHDAMNDCVRNPGKAALLKKKMANVKAMEKRFERETGESVDSLEGAIDIKLPEIVTYAKKKIIDYHKEYLTVEDKLLMKDINLEVYGQDKVAITGNNGTGKSILLSDIYKNMKERNDLKIGYMPQNYMNTLSNYKNALDFMMTDGDREDVTKSREFLGCMKFTSEEMLNDITSLSDGQKAKLFLIKCMKDECDVLILDEPTRNLSPLSTKTIYELFKKYQGCIVCVTHDRMFLKEVFSCIYKVENKTLKK